MGLRKEKIEDYKISFKIFMERIPKVIPVSFTDNDFHNTF